MVYTVETDALTRRFGPFVAVDSVTLQIPKGCLYRFLGLNGAGKTTTIRMLTTLLPASAGTARLWGHDVVREPLAIRRLRGLGERRDQRKSVELDGDRVSRSSRESGGSQTPRTKPRTCSSAWVWTPGSEAS